MNEQGRPHDQDRHRDLAAEVTGAPPALSALTLRLVLAGFGLVVCGGAAVLFALLGLPRTLVIVAAVFAVIAVVDLVVITRRKLHGEPG